MRRWWRPIPRRRPRPFPSRRRDVEIRMHLLHIIVLVKDFHESQHLLGAFFFELDRVLRNDR